MYNLRQTLSSLFEPPRNFPRATGGVLCAYSAEASFLERALVRYTGVPAESRRLRGGVDLTLMTTPTQEVFSEATVPGLVHLRPREAKNRHAGFTVMHAKVALLGFATQPDGQAKMHRIIVGTGNWTQASARTQLEMFWSLDIGPDSAIEDRRELRAVADFLVSLMESFQCDDSFAGAKLLRDAIGASAPAASGVETRFFHSWDTKSLGDILLDRLERTKEDARPPNLLVCGSGFFDSHDRPDPAVLVINQVSDALCKRGVFTGKTRMVVTNASLDDHLTKCLRSGVLADWEVLFPAEPNPPKTSNAVKRSLHAKFIFLAYRHADSLTRQRLYLGSGNLTNNGFMHPPAQRGNIEAGVLLSPHEINNYAQLGRHLPIGRAPVAIDPGATLDPPNDPLRHPEAAEVVASPAICFLIKGKNTLEPKWDPAVTKSLEEITVYLDGRPLVIPVKQDDVRIETIPRSLKITWRDDCSAIVPCFDSTGGFKRAPLPPMHFDDWLAQLAGYPDAYDNPDVGGDDDDGDDDGYGVGGGGSNDAVPMSRDFPAHSAMVLVEMVSEKNSHVPETNADAWLRYLEFMLVDNKPTGLLDGWRSLGVNFLSVLLWREGFAPAWNNLEGYDDLVRRVAQEWGLSSYPAMEK